MSAVVGFLRGTSIATPDGDRTLGELAVGHAVWAWHLGRGERVARAVAALHHAGGPAACFLYRVDAGGRSLRGCTPGTAVYDAFEDMFRGVGSLSSLAELCVLGEEGQVAVAPVDDAVEIHVAEGEVLHLTLDGDEGCFFADGVLVRHLAPERRTGGGR
jgi:hypothetical protein